MSLAPPASPQQRGQLPLPGLATLWSLQRAQLVRARAYSTLRWVVALVTLVHAVLLIGDSAGPKALHKALIVIGWLAVPMCLAFFSKSSQSKEAVVGLARLCGVGTRHTRASTHAARAWLLFKPLGLSAAVLWIALAWNLRSISMLPGVLLGLLFTWLCMLALSVGLVVLAAFGEQLTPRHPVRTLALVVLLPALLHSAVPELPSLMNAYSFWTANGVEFLASS